jgi:hypothetical protein
MFNGRNRFNGFATGKPVCVLRLDSGGTEVKRKNRVFKIQRNALITKAFLHLTEDQSVVLEGAGWAFNFAYASPSSGESSRNAGYCIWA